MSASDTSDHWPTQGVHLRVWGDFACFTRPELRTERVSYPLITPTAARGVLEAILWKPQMRWRITQIDVLRRGHFLMVKRNEISRAPNAREMRAAVADLPGQFGLDITKKVRQQRATMLLRDVAYVIHAEIILRDPAEDVGKYLGMFERRVAKGQCVEQPFLGCREFVASFGPADPAEIPTAWTEPLGLMLGAVDYPPHQKPEPRFFPATVDKGTVQVPKEMEVT